MRLDRKDFQVYKSGEKPKKFPIETLYGLCMKSCVSFLSTAHHDFGYKDVEINFIIENGHKNIGDAISVFERIKKVDRTGLSKFMGSITPGDKKKFSGLQLADAMAYHAYISEGQGAEPTLTPVPDGVKLKDLKCPLYRIHANENVLAEFKANMFQIEKEQREWGQRRNNTTSSAQ